MKSHSKTLDLIGCRYVALTDVQYLHDLEELYLSLVKQGKREGFTPVFIDRGMEYDFSYSWLGLEDKIENYPTARKMILDKAYSADYSFWHQRLIDDVYLYGCEDDEDREYTLNELNPVSDQRFHELMDNLKIETGVNLDNTSFYDAGPNFSAENNDVIALIPTSQPYEIPAWIPMGGFNWCPLPEYHVALAKHFYETYGAQIMAISFTMMDYYVPHPLTDMKSVQEAARELMIADEDVYQDMELAIQRVYGKTRWHLWWD